MRWRGLASTVAFAAGSAAAAAANSWNLEAGLTGVPREDDLGAEETCTTCHTTAALNPDGFLLLGGVRWPANRFSWS